MTACQLNSSYIINNLSSPTIYLPHDVPAFFHSTQVVCMLSMPYALFLYQHTEDKTPPPQEHGACLQSHQTSLSTHPVARWQKLITNLPF